MTLPKNVDDLLPLTPMQHLMLLHSLTAPSQRALLNQVCYDIRGPLREKAFRGALDAVVARHPALRTGFLWEGLEQPLQVVRSQVTLPFRAIDLAALPEREQQRRLDAVAQEDLASPMPVGRAPLMRCTLCRLSDRHHRFLWTAHHLVVDRWSHGTLLSELGQFHAALVDDRDAALPPVRAFREYVAWLSRSDSRAAEAFWRQELAGFSEPDALAGRAPRVASERKKTHRPLGAEVSSALRARAAEWRTTVATLILAGTGIALAHRLRRLDVLCGLTVSGRPPDLDDAEAIVGSFVNNVPVRIRIDRQRPLAEWVKSVQRDQVRRQRFEHVSLRDIRAWAEVPYPRPLFDLLLLLNVADEEAIEWPGIEIRPIAATLDAAYPLVLAAGADGADLALTLVHDDSFGDAGGFLAEITDAIGELAAAHADVAVGTLVPELATTARNGVTDGAAGRLMPDESTGVARGAALSEAMLQSWRDVLGSDDVGVDDDFFGLGGTSLQAMELLVRLERLVGRVVPVSMLLAAGSVRGLLAELGQPLEYAAPLVRLRSSGARRPLVAVPGIGGNVLGLVGLARALGPDQPFYALQSPGLDGREAPLRTIEEIAARYVDQVLASVDRPFDLLGFCWGAAVAFEMAGRLRSAGRAPLSLQLMDPAALLRDTSSGGASAEATFLRRRLELYWGELRDADWRQRGRFVTGKARRVAGVLAGDERREESREELNRFKVERANREAITRYDPGRYEGRATVFLSSGRAFADGQDPRLEWLQLISPRPDVLHVDGADSGDVISPAHVASFASVLRDRLDASAEPATAR